jgi:hypothetical protein
MEWPLIFGVGAGAAGVTYLNEKTLDGKIPLPGALGAGAIAYAMTENMNTAIFSAAGTMAIDMVMNTTYVNMIKKFITKKTDADVSATVAASATGVSAAVASGLMQFMNLI